MKNSRICLICLCLLSFSSAFAQDYLQESNQTGVSGYVLEKLTGKPIQNAHIFLGPADHNIVTAADSNGFFELSGLVGPYESYIYIVAKNFVSSKIPFTSVEGKIIEGMKIELMPSSKVAGFIKDETGNPVAGATVAVFSLPNQSVKTDANGFYEIDGLDPAFGNYQISAKSKNHPPVTIDFTSASAQQTAKVDIVLKAGVTIYGQVTDPQGNPLPKVTVGNTESVYMWNCVKAKTDANGFFELKNIDKGRLTLWAIHPQYPPYVERFNIDAKDSEKQVNIKFENPKPLRGKIVDKKGNPVEGVNVGLREFKGVEGLNDHKWFITDSQGKFTIENAPSSGKVVLQVWSQTVPTIMPEIEIGKDENIIVVQRAGKIYGQVIDNASGKPIPAFNVKLGSSQKNKEFAGGYDVSWEREGHNFNDPNGFFDTGADTFPPIDANYIVTIYANGFDPLTVDPVKALSVSNEPNRTILKLTSPSIVEGTVVNEQNEPVVGASVRWFSQSNRLQMSGEHWDSKDTTMTDSNGRFRFDTIGSGKRGIYITAAGFAPFIDANLILPDDKDELSEIVLEKGAEVYGTVYKDGKPAAGIRIICDLNSRFDLHLQQMGYIHKETVSDANGDYHLSDLPTGEVGISAFSPAVDRSGNVIASKKVTLSPSQKTKLDFGNEQGITVSGQVRRGQTPIIGANITFISQDNSSKGAASDSNGFYKVTGMPKGKYNVSTFYSKPGRSAFSSSSPNPDDFLQDNQRIDVNSDMILNIDFGTETISGKIPPEFVDAENLRLMARRWNPQTLADDDKLTYRINWEYVNSQTKLDPNGSFVFSNLKPGKYFLVLYNQQQCLAISKIFELTSSQNVNGISFVPSVAKLRITVLNAENKQPLADAVCGLTNNLELYFHDSKSDPNSPMSKTDAAGQIEFDKLPAGTYAFSASRDGFLPALKKNVQIDANTTALAEITLEKSAMVKFVLNDAAKKLITLPTVLLWCQAVILETQQPYTVRTFYGETKRYSVYLQMPLEYSKNTFYKSCLNLPTGKYRLEYELFPYDADGVIYGTEKPFLSGQTEVNVIAGQTTEVVIK
jgi:protocatechuate 3,4-dioxygenase beta subunit